MGKEWYGRIGVASTGLVAASWFGIVAIFLLASAVASGLLPMDLDVSVICPLMTASLVFSGIVGGVGAFVARRGLRDEGLQQRSLAVTLAFAVLELLLAPPLWLLGAVMAEGTGHGRPLQIRGRTRTAGSTERADWSEPANVAIPTDPAERAALAKAWTRIALAEHASIPAFARLSCELVALGAPPDLVERAHLAALDEARHARLAFGIASAYAGVPAGPGPLPEAIAPFEPGRIAADAAVDGVIGEGFAAAVLSECASRVSDPELARILTEIARDEAAHADLARDVLAWAGPADVELPTEPPALGDRPEAGGLDPATTRLLWDRVRASARGAGS